MDTSQLMQALRLNGITNNTPADGVDKILTALKCSPEEKQKAFDALKAQGWIPSEIVIEQDSPKPATVAPAFIPAIPIPVATVPTTTPNPVPMPVTSPISPAPQIPPAPVVSNPIVSEPPPMPTVAQVMPVAPYAQRPAFAAPNFSTAPATNKKSWLPYIIVALVLILAIAGGFVFAAKYNILSFTGNSAYTPESFFSTLLAKSATIKSVAYGASFSLDVGARDKGALPFQVVVTNAAALREQYQNDSQRSQDLSSINTIIQNSSYNYNNKPVIFPASLQKGLDDLIKKSSSYKNYYKTSSFKDPGTKKDYVYQSVDGGKDFNLTMTFETDTAIKAIRQSYNFVSTTTIINGKTVTFTKKSPTYLSLSSEPSKPLLVQLGESMRQLPADVNVSFDIGAQADLTDASTMANWLAQFNAEGSFGDLTYKVNAEARKKDLNYYFRINNIPSLFGSYSSLKGQWIKVSPSAATSTKSTGYNQYDYIPQELQSVEKSYKEQRQTIAAGLKKVAEIADGENLITFKNNPQKETVDGRSLTRYELQIRKEAILPFYQKLLAEMNKDKTLKDYSAAADQGLLEYLQSDEFNQIYDYVDKNVQFLFYADSQGYPAIIEEKMRIVPPDTAVQLKDKQVNIIFKMTFNDVNKPVNIQVPENARPLSEVMAEFEKNQYGYDASGESQMKANLASIRAQAEIVYSSSKNSYGTKAFALGSCKQTSGTMFGNGDLFKQIQDATKNNPSTATCVSKGTSGNIQSWALSAPLSSDPTYSWCVDSAGSSKQIKGAITSDSCK